MRRPVSSAGGMRYAPDERRAQGTKKESDSRACGQQLSGRARKPSLPGIDSLRLTLGTDAGSIKKFDIFRKKRNISDYERADTISASDVEEMRSLAEKLRVDFEAWIQKNHPQLKP